MMWHMLLVEDCGVLLSGRCRFEDKLEIAGTPQAAGKFEGDRNSTAPEPWRLAQLAPGYDGRPLPGGFPCAGSGRVPLGG